MPPLLFAAVQTNPFGLSYSGNNSAPAFVDFDNDGDLDMMSGNTYGEFVYFQNTGTNAAPAFAPVVDNPFGLTSIGSYNAPTFTDLDNDGDFDMMAGDNSGNFLYFQNTGSNNAPAFAAPLTTPFGLTDIGSRSIPAFGDLDNDGDFDIIAGEEYGEFYYFENTGNIAAPAFASAQTTPFGLTNVGYYNAPALADLDNDGDLDMMVGQNASFFYFENTPPLTFVWDGSGGTSWNVGDNWSTNSVPTTTDNVTIPNVANDPIIGNGVTISDVSLASGATLQVSSGGSLTLNGALANSGAVTIQSGGSFLQGNSSSISGGGAFTVQRQGGTGVISNFWSSPITAQPTVPGDPSYQFLSNLATQDDSDDQPQDTGWSEYNGTMTPGRGYVGRAGGLFSFSGTPNNGNITVSVYQVLLDNTFTQTTGGSPFNLVGNPYPSAISANSLIAANSIIEGTIYFWDDDNTGGAGYTRSDFAYWNGTGGLGSGGGSVGAPDGNIATGQGFYVIAEIDVLGGLNFTNSMRITGTNTQFFKPNGEDSRMWFSIDNETYSSQVLIGLLQDATEEEDRLYDGIKMKGNDNISLSTIGNDMKHAIMAFPPPNSEKSVPLSVFVNEAGNYNFKAGTMENFDGFQIYLQDLQNGTSVPVLEGVDIQVNLTQGDHDGRFFLNFVPSLITKIEEDATSATVSAYTSNGQLYVALNADTDMRIQQLELLDMSGRLVMRPSVAGQQNNMAIGLNGIDAGVYIVRISTNTQTFSRKIVKH